MNQLTRLTALFTLGFIVILPAQVAAKDSTLPPASPFYVLVGKWQGQGELGQAGQAPTTLALNYQCQKTAADWGVMCQMQATNKEMAMAETDLFGHDPVNNQSHWFAVTNTGETHDHKAKWINDHTMQAHYGWSQDGKQMEENVTFTLNGKRTLVFKSVVSQDGKEIASFQGNLKR